jgi:hypothetical protein
MAKQTLSDLKARLALVGASLVEEACEQANRFYIFDTKKELLVSCQMTLAEVLEWIASEEIDAVKDGRADAPALVEHAAAETADDQKPVVTVLAGDLTDELCGIGGIALAFTNSSYFDDLPEHVQNLALALRTLSRRVVGAMGSVEPALAEVFKTVAVVRQ